MKDEALSQVCKKIKHKNGWWETTTGEKYISKTIAINNQKLIERERLRAI